MIAPSAVVEFDGLLGRDFLANFRFVYDGPSSAFELLRRTT